MKFKTFWMRKSEQKRLLSKVKTTRLLKKKNQLKRSHRQAMTTKMAPERVLDLQVPRKRTRVAARQPLRAPGMLATVRMTCPPWPRRRRIRTSR